MLPDSWSEFIATQKKKDYMVRLASTLKDERAKFTIYPSKDLVFNAFKLTPPDKTKVVILGQDPYHGPNQAMGLAFSVPSGQKIPPSLRNIFTELHDDLKIEIPVSGDLTRWAKQGVLLLNTCLTVRAGSPMSHANTLGWESFIYEALSTLNINGSKLVFIAWGSHAFKFIESSVSKSGHHIIKSAHPSPLSAYRGFFGSRPFSRTNEFLVQNGTEPIDWSLN